MEQRSGPAAPLELRLVEDVPHAVTPAQAGPPGETIDIGQPKVAVADIDPHIAQATREHARGFHDQALWGRAVTLADGDEAAAVRPYLRARAAMLKLAQQRQATARPAPPPPEAPKPEGERESAVVGTRSLLGLRPRVVLLAGACAAAAALAAAIWMWSASDKPPVAAARVKAASAPRVPAPPAAVAAAPASPGAEFAAKIEELRKAGNWHVLVLHAAEWTRKEPENAAGWAALSDGYARLGQVDESFEAAKRAVALDGTNPTYLRRLADAYVVLERPADALVHVEKLVALDGRDADALTRAGALYLALGRLPEAHDAFGRALEIDPSSRASNCGAIDVARRQGRAKEAEALAKALKSAGGDCGAASAPR